MTHTGNVSDDSLTAIRAPRTHAPRKSENSQAAGANGFESLISSLVSTPITQQDAPEKTPEKVQEPQDNSDSQKLLEDQTTATLNQLPNQTPQHGGQSAVSATPKVAAAPATNTNTDPIAQDQTAAPAAPNVSTVTQATEGEALQAIDAGTQVGQTELAQVSPKVVTATAATTIPTTTPTAQNSGLGQAGAATTAPTSEASQPEAASNPTPAAPTGTAPTTGNPTPNKAKPVNLDGAKADLLPSPDILQGTPSAESNAAMETGTASTSQAAGAGTQTSSPSLSPNAMPMLAATMMRRLDSGARQFTMRLDPPELGQVEVKLSVSADKKVRAVISADRPEALADLTRSARELAQALSDAGLDLEENGLSFSLNDQAGNQERNNQRQEANTPQPFPNRPSTDNGEADLTDAQGSSQLVDQQNNNSDPFQRWQRARIALTA